MADKQLRTSRQRRVILDELRKVTSHPTADEVYEMVRKKLPHISLGTVYRNLEVMSESGIVLKLHVGEAQKRFDGNPANHYHVKCSHCGRVDDVDMAMLSNIEKAAESATGYEINSHNVEFIGVCPHCRCP
ncbi:MAG: transcriptional repressor [Armatimonadota bacterium]|nr:transcriptional repressor [bacterium]